MTEPAARFDGVLLVDKPLRCTSHDVVQSLRRILGVRRIGHVGTLDPLAQGLLVVCVGRATKVVQFLTGLDKQYEAEITLGKASPTLDSEGIDLNAPANPIDHLSEADLLAALKKFEGSIEQRVPAFSAVRVGGEPLYRKARRGEEVTPPTRTVTIADISLSSYRRPVVSAVVTCSSGTYIRTLADDLGRVLGCGAYLSHLRRTRVGHLHLSSALTIEQVADAVADAQVQRYLLGYGEVLRLGALCVTDEFRPHVIEGRQPLGSDLAGSEGSFCAGDTVLLKGADGAVLAIGRAGIASDLTARGADHRVFDYIRVLN